MPARVEFRLGSIFDEPCDLLVIPSSAGGTVTPDIQQELRNAGLPFPTAITLGAVECYHSPNPGYGFVAYAAAVSGQTSSPETVHQIGREMGKLASEMRAERIAAPLLGAGSGDLAPAVAAQALTRGFQESAPESAVLVISIRSIEKLDKLAEDLPSPVGDGVRALAATARDDPWKSMRDRLLGPHLGRLLTGRARRARDAAPTPSPARAPTSATATPPVSGASGAAAPSGRKGVFISYSHADADWLARLQKHLRPLEREGVVLWDDTRLRPGEPWREEIREALAQTRVAILLISADFLASDFIVTDELPPLLKAAEEEGATILPVIISPCRFTRTPSLSRFQSVNDPEKPLVQMRRANREKVLDQVARAVEDALKR